MLIEALHKLGSVIKAFSDAARAAAIEARRAKSKGKADDKTTKPSLGGSAEAPAKSFAADWDKKAEGDMPAQKAFTKEELNAVEEATTDDIMAEISGAKDGAILFDSGDRGAGNLIKNPTGKPAGLYWHDWNDTGDYTPAVGREGVRRGVKVGGYSVEAGTTLGSLRQGIREGV